MYRNLTIYSYLDGKDGGTDYEKVLDDVFVIHHMGPAVKAVLAAKQLSTTKRRWRLPPCILYRNMRIELDAISDGCWGVQAGSTTCLYLIQHYIFQGEKRVNIYLFSSATSLNPLTNISHQTDPELGGLALAVKETTKALSTLGDFNLTVNPRLTSNSQTYLSLCCKASVQLHLRTALVVNRVQQVFGHQNIFFAPGDLFQPTLICSQDIE